MARQFFPNQFMALLSGERALAPAVAHDFALQRSNKRPKHRREGCHAFADQPSSSSPSFLARSCFSHPLFLYHLH